MQTSNDYICPHCGELVDTSADTGAGESYNYVEDCPVCCRPNLIRARLVDGEFVVEASAE